MLDIVYGVAGGSPRYFKRYRSVIAIPLRSALTINPVC
jgi:hypothetical protein